MELLLKNKRLMLAIGVIFSIGIVVIIGFLVFYQGTKPEGVIEEHPENSISFDSKLFSDSDGGLAKTDVTKYDLSEIKKQSLNIPSVKIYFVDKASDTKINGLFAELTLEEGVEKTENYWTSSNFYILKDETLNKITFGSVNGTTLKTRGSDKMQLSKDIVEYFVGSDLDLWKFTEGEESNMNTIIGVLQIDEKPLLNLNGIDYQAKFFYDTRGNLISFDLIPIKIKDDKTLLSIGETTLNEVLASGRIPKKIIARPPVKLSSTPNTIENSDGHDGILPFTKPEDVKLIDYKTLPIYYPDAGVIVNSIILTSGDSLPNDEVHEIVIPLINGSYILVGDAK